MISYAARPREQRGVAVCLLSDPALLGFRINHPISSIYNLKETPKRKKLVKLALDILKQH